jgi:alginate O-acetyltransferase complex protein AlgJ
VLALLVTGGPSWVLAADAPSALEREYKQRCEELMPQMLTKGVHKIILGPDGWLLLRDELRYAVTGRFWGIAALSLKPSVPMANADPITAIAAFRDELARKGIELLFAPAPTRPLVVPEAVLGKGKVPPGKTTPRLQPVEEEFFAALRAQGVEALDLTKVLLAHRQSEHGPLYVPGDSHWTGATVVLAGEEIGAWAKRRSWYKDVDKQRFETSWTTVEHFGYLYKDLYERAGLEKRPPDTVQCRSVRAVAADGAKKKIESRNPSSPVILIGDSHTVWWRSQEGALFQQLAAELGFPVDTLSTSGGGNNESRLNLVRTARSTPGYLEGKKLVIWCFTSRDLLVQKDGWMKTPLDAPTVTEESTTVPEEQPPAGATAIPAHGTGRGAAAPPAE